MTTSRADLGPLAPVIAVLDDHPQIELMVIATGTHSGESRGSTIGDIRLGPSSRLETVACTITASTPEGLIPALGEIGSGVSRVLSGHDFDALVLLGDRWELLAVASAALLHAVPIVHLHGGEITEGAIDERVRHALTKLSDLHLCATGESARRLLQMGEEPWRVVTTGAPGLDRLVGAEPAADELEAVLGRHLDRPFGIVTYHPATVDRRQVSDKARAVLEACAEHLATVVVTYPGADPGADTVIEEIHMAASRHGNVAVRPHLGATYVAAMATADVMVGNSSSGICEAASFKLPVVDVGERQRGRLRGGNVIHAEEDQAAVGGAIARALAPEFRARLGELVNPYGDGQSSERIVDAILQFSGRDRTPKRFVDRLEQT